MEQYRLQQQEMFRQLHKQHRDKTGEDNRTERAVSAVGSEAAEEQPSLVRHAGGGRQEPEGGVRDDVGDARLSDP